MIAASRNSFSPSSEKQEAGGRFHLKLNNSKSPIAHKYCEGKMQSTLKGEFKVLEIVKRETIETVLWLVQNSTWIVFFYKKKKNVQMNFLNFLADQHCL